MSTETTQRKNGPPQIFKLDKAFKLAEQWVNNMTAPAEDEPCKDESEGRPARLGLGAKVSRQAKFRPSDDPVEKKLHFRLDIGKRNAAKSAEESAPAARDELDDDDDEDNLESRSSAFAKKRAIPPTSSLPATKKQK